MSKSLNPLMLSSYRVTSPNFPDSYFTKFSGVEATRPVATFADGYSPTKQKRVGQTEYSNITISKPYDPTQDGALVALLDSYCEGEDTNLITITVTPIKVCNNIERKGNTTFTLLGCRPVRVKVAEVDSDSMDGISILEVELTVDSVKR